MLHSLHHPSTQHADRTPALILLHGRGADEHDLFGLKRRLDPRFDIYSLRAPFEFDWGGYTWFDLFDDGTVDEKSFTESKTEILSFVASLNTKDIYLLGFSMGAIMSYALSLTDPPLCKGIVALSGFAPLQLENEYRLTELQHLQFFISHGINDPVIPVAMARRTKEMLSHTAAAVSYHEYDTGHQINEQCVADFTEWLSGRLSNTATAQ
ncbi:MAG: alpha/beta hydrolase [Bacteroidota bacterium]